MVLTHKLFGLALLSFAFLQTTVLAGPEYVPIQEKAQGQSLAGSSILNDSLYVNPAGSAFTRIYAVEGTYQMPKGFAVSVLDTNTSEIGGGIGYFRQKVQNFEEMLQGVKVGIVGKMSNQIGTGLAAKFIWGPDLSGSPNRLNDLDFGMLGNFDIVQVGFTARNLIGGNLAMDQQREWSIGGRIHYNQTVFLNVATTASFQTFSPYQVGIGAEYVSPYYFSLKGGYRHRFDIGQGFWSMGASLIAPKVAVHYAAEFPPGNSSQGIEHTIAASLLF